jgi:hypothetical protein
MAFSGIAMAAKTSLISNPYRLRLFRQFPSRAEITGSI